MKLLQFRTYEGVNVYSYSPVIKATIDLENLNDISTAEIAGFTDKLIKAIPSLGEHHCTVGTPGGFIKRLREGTYFGHVLEHLILEIQHLVGDNVIYGKTRLVKEPRIYDVVFEYKIEAVGLKTMEYGIKIINDLTAGESIDINFLINDVMDTASKSGLGPTTQALADEAALRKIPVLRIGETSILQLGYGCGQKRIEASITDNTGCIGVDIASDKGLTKQILADAGIPVPVGGAAGTERAALVIANEIGFPVVVKPINGNQGRGVITGIENEKDLQRAFFLAQSFDKQVIVEKHVVGRHYRLLVVGGKMVAAAERVPAKVTGDGEKTIRQLIEQVNQDPKRGYGHERPLTKLKVDAVVINTLAEQGLELGTVLESNREVVLRANGNLSTGGTAIDVTDLVHPDTAVLAVRVARLIGLDVAGIDVVANDISSPLLSNNGAVIEVNAAPGLRMHLFPSAGRPRNVASEIMDYLFPPESRSRIPIAAITGTNGKTTTTRIMGHIIRLMGKTVGMATTDGIYINEERVVCGDTTGPLSAKTVLMDKSVEVAVLETARGGILRSGLGFDYCDVGIITNITDDHLGIDGIETLEDLAWVKSLVVETVQRKGVSVLNADDSLVAQLADRAKGEVIFFSKSADNLVVRRHLGAGGRAVFIREGAVILAMGDQVTRIAYVKRIPITLCGLAEHNVENVLAAVAGCLGMGIPVKEIRQGLISFGIRRNANPGRLNFIEVGGIKVIVDYGHNAAGYKSILHTAKKMKHRNIIGVIGVPGDRRNEAIGKVGFIAGRGFERIIIKEDSELRGRAPGEVAELLKRGAMDAGMSSESIDIVLQETAALKKALAIAVPGDLVVVFFEKLEPILQILDQFEESLTGNKVAVIG